jgi:hypothetical protein
VTSHADDLLPRGLRPPSPGTRGEGGGEGASGVEPRTAPTTCPHPDPLPEYRERGPEELAFDHDALDRLWRRKPGFYGWLTTTNHKSIGLRFVFTAFIFFLLAGLLALAMRTQLAVPENTLLGPDLYNQFFTTHGSAMMFLPSR